ncbi:hypothetical protein [Halorubrum amylolyticum]|uniref:hypothetical protein n=1 Tax=Halorubrum amylolyticum TaxID=2508724 RepID=UPI0010092B56|nr:hypothetical protein [Halorubrum amylolyticum]
MIELTHENNTQQQDAIEKTLNEVKRIGGEKFYNVAKNWEEDAHSGSLQELAQAHNLELTPENATRIAKKEITHIVEHHDELGL